MSMGIGSVSMRNAAISIFQNRVKRRNEILGVRGCCAVVVWEESSAEPTKR